ncbi:WXG100 family type VII secretion target [Candidatus Protofrankia californiensis]|uniref:WXG100 family type VII secretion target n=1 Tax=Candidatus Protofrankia californiensis TaxID=1839754 RepID=UPI0010419EAC|nr:WXG100 family type VII secretion target [Candidatus Protofrankia californiensis]
MNRPTDWAVLDLDADPAPGDPFSVQQLARRFLEFAADVEYARGQVASLGAGGVVESWLGDAGDAFRKEIAEFPSQLQKLETSYRMVGDALIAYEPILAAAQVQADRALAQGRDARSRRDSAQNLLGPAQAVLTADAAAFADLSSASSTYTADVPPPPDPVQVAQAIRNRDAAQARLDQVRNAVRDGQDELDAARRLALSAKALREDAADTCVRMIRDASDAGIRNKPWYSWEKVKETAGKVWTVAVQVAKITVAVLGVVALIIGGPAAWVVFAAAVVVLADTLVKYGNGQASRWDVAFALPGSVPGTKGLTTVGGLARGIRGGSRAVAGIRSVADAGKLLLGGGRTLVRGGQEMALGAVATGRRRLAAATAAVRRSVADPAGVLRAAGSDIAAAGVTVRTAAVRFPESAGLRSTSRMAGEAGSDAAALDRAADATVTGHADEAPSTANGAGHGAGDDSGHGGDSGGGRNNGNNDGPTSPDDNPPNGPDPDGSPHASGSAGGPGPGGNSHPDRGSEAGTEDIGNHISPGDQSTFTVSRTGLDSDLMAELAASGVKHTPEEIIQIGRDPAGRIVFLEQGNERAGFEHILRRHQSEFEQAGIAKDQIPEFIMRALTEGRPVGSQRATPILEVEFGGRLHNVAATTGGNGYVVSANMRSAPN